MIKRLAVGIVVLALGACDAPELAGSLPPKEEETRPAPVAAVARNQEARRLAQRFVDVVEAVEPVAEQICRQETRGMNCDFRIVIDDRRGMPANAFQTLDANGRPIVVFTLALIARAQNADEIAFVLGHETAHHIAGHIARQRDAAAAGSELLSGIARRTGLDAQGQQVAQEIGAVVGARSFSRDFELEADLIGTRIAARAGFNPLTGSAFFARIPDPGDQFLGTHPPNSQRVAVVRQEAARLGF